jgi:hypothetical protein
VRQRKIQQAANMIGVKVGNDQVADVAGVESPGLKLSAGCLGFIKIDRGEPGLVAGRKAPGLVKEAAGVASIK